MFLRASEAEQQMLLTLLDMHVKMAIQDNTKISNVGNRFYRVWTKHNTWYGAKRENRDEKWMTSVSDGLQDSLLIRKNVCISLIHCSKLIKEGCHSDV